MSDDNKDRTDEIFDRIRNHRWLSLLVVAGTIVIGLGALTNAIESIRDFVLYSPQPTEPPETAGRDHSDGGNLGSDTLSEIARALSSDDPLTRRTAVLTLKKNPDQAVSLLITSPVLGAIDKAAAREDTAFTSIVRETLVAAGPPAVEPLINEWRRTRAELRSRFAQHSKTFRAEIIGFIQRDLNPEFSISADGLAQAATRSGRLSSDDTEALEQLRSVDTLELVSAHRNIERTVAELLRAHRVEGLNLSGLEIHGDFRRANLQGANLSRCELVGANLSGSDLSGANLREANLNIADLSQAKLRNADMVDISTADGADFSQATLDGSNFSHSRAINAKFRNASLRQVNFSESVLTRSDFSGADLSGARLTHALLTDANLKDLQGFENVADMHITNLRNARGLSENQREAATSRGAVWDHTVATTVDDFPENLTFPQALRDHIRYDGENSALIWRGDEMSEDAYNELRRLLNPHVDSSNGILRLKYRAWYARTD